MAGWLTDHSWLGYAGAAGEFEDRLSSKFVRWIGGRSLFLQPRALLPPVATPGVLKGSHVTGRRIQARWSKESNA